MKEKSRASSCSRPSSPASSNERGEDEYQGSFESFISKIWRSSDRDSRDHMCAAAIKMVRKDKNVVTDAAGKELKTLLCLYGNEEDVQSLLDLMLDIKPDVITPLTFASFVIDIRKSNSRNSRDHMCASAIKMVRKDKNVVTDAAGKELKTLLRYHGNEEDVQSLLDLMLDTKPDVIASILWFQ